MLPFEAFLALRYLRPRRTFVSVITVVSIIGVMLGVAVLIVVIAVMSGMDQEWRERILGFNAHLKIYNVDGSAMTNYPSLMKAVSTNPNVVGVSPFIWSTAAVSTEPSEGTEPNLSAPLLLGIDPATQTSVSVLSNSIIEGAYDFHDKGLLVGSEFARSMQLHTNDLLAVYSPDNLRKLARTAGKTNEEAFAPEEFTVRGIFDVGFADYNSSVIVASLADAGDLEKLPPGAVNGIEVKLRDPFLVSEVTNQLAAVLGGSLWFKTWHEDAPAIFEALAVEKNMMFFILFFIMIVAAFGIVSSQITFVVQKTREIGILKALGAGNRQVMWLFLSQSVIVGILGVGLGFALAMAALDYRNGFLRLMEQLTHTQLLSPAIYHVYQLPASVETGDVLVICGTAFCTCVLAGLFPAWTASRLQPVEALRYE